MNSTATAKPGRIAVIDDEPDIRLVITDALTADGHEVLAFGDGESGLAAILETSFDIAFIDINLPGIDGFDVLAKIVEKETDVAVVIITGRATVANAIEATRAGAYEYVTKPFDLDKIRLLARNVMQRRVLQVELDGLRDRERSQHEPGVEIVGQSPPMQEVYKTIGRVADSSAVVLLQGESGTGKERIARAIHAWSNRWLGPFIAVNCSAIPDDLLESEMFGHERGAFTGASGLRRGKFEQARGGTLLLDEIGEMPLALQAKLLRVLQEKEFSRVGGHETIAADCRIVAATNQVLEKAVSQGRFREDLYYRLKVVVIDIPPLRERSEDIPSLVDYFLDNINREHGFAIRGLSPDALSSLLTHDWPGNVRELENVLVRAAAMAPSRLLTTEDLPFSAPREANDYPSMSLEEIVVVKLREYLDRQGDSPPGDLHPRVLELVEKPLIEVVLERVGGNQLHAARMLGINRNTLRKKITDLDIDLRAFGDRG
ncbi:MAG: sigma-54-dependent Fis family transcriptional regulator [Deltaproteobacteria bacterium]|nr:sigma-54-dependent Fis family transcriptional regulator [Deltaproteobacteria bacterium]